MQKLDKNYLLSLIKETVYNVAPGNATVPVAKHGEYDPQDSLINYEEQTERIVSLIHDMTKSIRDGSDHGDLSPHQMAKIKDFQIKRIRRSIEYMDKMIGSFEGEDLDMTTPEI
jgi:4-hydroxy-3-methylbut-2-en-1-yl diphosphate synthase IspG/GcpE